MMKYSFGILILFLLCSCKNKYEGNWASDYLKETTDSPKSIVISEDSITFSFWAFDYYHKYPLKIKNKELLFNDWRIKTKIVDDTLSLSNVSFYVKDPKDSLSNRWFGNPIIDVKLPKLEGVISKTIDTKFVNFYIHFGKRIDNRNYSLQLNDKFAEIVDLPAFVTATRASKRDEEIPFYTAVLFIDNTTPLKYVEDVFHQLKLVNLLKVSLINDINLTFSDSLGIYYEYSFLSKKLFPMFANDTYSPSYSNAQTPPPPPFVPKFENDNSNVSYFILEDNTILHNKKEVISSEITLFVEKAINENHVIISLYDLESNYESFLNMNALIDGVYNKKRNELALKTFNKSYEELETEQATEIKQEIPLKYIWSYSIPHYQEVTKNGSRFFGLKVKPIDSLLPSRNK